MKGTYAQLMTWHELWTKRRFRHICMCFSARLTVYLYEDGLLQLEMLSFIK